MEHRCPYCGNVIQYGLYCNVCLNKVNQFEKIWAKSAFYYNKGIIAAKERELSLARLYLQKAIILYKYNIEARNLLGLIYLEVGQLGNALKEWIMSQSLKREDNLATYYIEAIQKQPKYLEASKEAIMLYNRALGYLKQNNRDMAMIRLKKAVKLQPQFVEARTLLALNYMEQNQYYKANEQVKRVLMIDKGNRKALDYFNRLSSKDVETVAPYEKEVVPKQMYQVSFERIINRTSHYPATIISFGLGVLAMVVVGKFLFLPNEIKNYKDENKRLIEVESTLSTQVQTLSKEYEEKVSQLQESKEKLEGEIEKYKSEVSVFEQKEKLSLAQSQIEEGKYIEAAETIYGIAVSYLDEGELETLEKLKERIYPIAIQRLYDEATSLYYGGHYTEATTKFETLLLYNPENRTTCKTLYYLAQICEACENMQSAKKYYEKIVSNYPETRQAIEAQDRLNVINES